MEDIKIIVYVILGIVYLVSRVNKAVKKGAKNANKQTPRPNPIEPTNVMKPKKKSNSFQDSLSDFLKEAASESDMELPEILNPKSKTEKVKTLEQAGNKMDSEYLVDEMGDKHLSLELETREDQRARLKTKREKRVAKSLIEQGQINDVLENQNDFEFDLQDAVVYDAIMKKPYE